MPPKRLHGRPARFRDPQPEEPGPERHKEGSVNMGDGAGPQGPGAAPPPQPPIADIATIALVVNQVLQQQGIQPVRAAAAPPLSGTKLHYKSLKDSDLPLFEGGPDPLKAESWLDMAQ